MYRTYSEIVSYESVTWIECSVYANASLTLTWTLILIENGIQNVWTPVMDYEILTCSLILHEQEFPLEILTESETPLSGRRERPAASCPTAPGTRTSEQRWEAERKGSDRRG